jgi:hypothetical protein
VSEGSAGLQPRPNRAVAVLRPGRLRRPRRGDQFGVGLEHDVGLEAILLPGRGFVRVPGVQILCGDRPVRATWRAIPPAAVRAATALGRFDVLPGNQGQQGDRTCSLALKCPDPMAANTKASVTMGKTS